MFVCLFVFDFLFNANQYRVYMRDVVETAHIFFKLMERFCKGSVVVQDKQKSRKKTKRTTKKPSNRDAQTTNDEQVSAIL